MKKRLWQIGLGLIVLVLLLPFLVPVGTAGEISDPRELGKSDSKFSDINQVQVHYRIRGDQEPVFILLHGFGASTYSWRNVLDPISDVGTAVAFDRPGFGLTERPLSWEGENPYSPEAQVGIVLGLMDELGVEQAVLIGNSAGGTVALNTALNYPDRVAGLVLVDAAVYTGGGSPAWIRPLLFTPQVDHLGPLLARAIQRRGDDFIRTAWHDPDQITEEVFFNYREPLQIKNWDRALWELTRASRPLELDQRLQEISLPTLVITGDDDRVVPTEESIRLAGDIPGADLAVLENCGHLPQEECPEMFLSALFDFVSDAALDEYR